MVTTAYRARLAKAAAITSGTVWCKVRGCDRAIYYSGLCSDHWERSPEAGCEHTGRGSIRCGCCKRRVCFKCYGHWKALACVQCREKATS